MFTKFFRRNVQTVPAVDLEQLDLDCLRISYADFPEMQLHLDRMQTLMDASRAH